MAEKKKTTTKKAVAKKTATKAKPKTTTKKVASTAKSTTAKAVKKTPAKKVAAKKPVVKKTTVKSTPASSSKLSLWFSWSQWTLVLGKAIDCWKVILGRFVLITGLSFALQVLGVVVLIGGVWALIGQNNSLENILANMMIGTPPPTTLVQGMLLMLSVWFLYAVTIGMMSKVAFLSLIKQETKGGKFSSVWNLFFVEGWKRLGAYLWLATRVFVYVMWPLFGLLAFVFATGQIESVNQAPVLVFPEGLEPVAKILAVLTFAYMVYAGIKMVLALPLLIHTGKTANEAYQDTKNLSKGAWFYIGSMWMLFMVILYALNTVLAIASAYDPIVLIDAVDPDNRIGAIDLLAFLMSLFIFAPITAAFQYYLMLQTAKNQSVKL